MPATKTLDVRRNAYRHDLAAATLEGKVDAERFVEGTRATAQRGAIAVRRAPDATLGIETEMLFGETATVFDEAGGWAWVQLERDGYVGYVPGETLRKGALTPTHKVSALGTFLYPAPSIKTPPLMHLAMNAGLSVRRSDANFAELESGGFVHARHIAPIDKNARDFVEIAERFVGTPYLWGGRTRIGIDCSGLIQIALEAAGISAPRDSDMQQAELGTSVPITAELDNLKRGDLVFWKGHVGVMLDSVMFVHANAHHMMVTIEPLPEAARRIAKTSDGIVAINRLAAAAV